MRVLTLEDVATNAVKPYKIQGLNTGGTHGKWTAITLLESNKEVELYSLGGQLEDNYKKILELDIKVVFASLGGGFAESKLDSAFYKTVKKLKQKGVIFFTSIGNTDRKYVEEYALSKEFINIAAVNKYNEHIPSSIKSELVDFAGLGVVELPDLPNDPDFKKTFVGTSFSTPVVVGMAVSALARFKKHGYSLNQKQLYKFMADHSDRFSNAKNEVGHGIFKVPANIDYKKYGVKDLPNIPTSPGGVEMSKEFKDVNKESWHYEPISKAVEEGLLKGYKDNTFRPGGYPTRAELAQFGVNLLEKIRKEK